MTNPNKDLIDLYVENQKQFARAITLAGGNAALVMDGAWSEVLFTLATNNIAIDAVYRGESHEPNTR